MWLRLLYLVCKWRLISNRNFRIHNRDRLQAACIYFLDLR
jgi:hypothetical protein